MVSLSFKSVMGCEFHAWISNCNVAFVSESANSVAMIRHAMAVVSSAVQVLNPGQVPVLTCDQPLFALAKQIQWNWSNSYGEDKFVVLFGDLHIEMAALKTLGSFLTGSGWSEMLTAAEITTAGTAESLLYVRGRGNSIFGPAVTESRPKVTYHIRPKPYASPKVKRDFRPKTETETESQSYLSRHDYRSQQVPPSVCCPTIPCI